MNEAVADTSTPRLAGVVSLVDRFLPALWIGLYLLLPVSGWASEMFDSWFDQRRDLEALRSLLADGHADAIADSVIGPAYIGAAALVHEVTGLSPEDSLIALTRASYALAVAAGLVLVRVLLGRLAGPLPPLTSLASQIAFLAVVLAAGTWYWSDVPWSHFLAAFLAVAWYAARFVPTGPSYAQAALAGALLALLAATRSFELVSVVLAWAIVAGGLMVLRRVGPATLDARRLLVGAGAFVVATGLVYAGTGKRDLFFLYGSQLDRQSGSLSGAEVAETPTLSLGLVPVKLVQLFVDPCYLSLCSTSDYETGGGGGTNLDLWSLPLAIQLPALLLLPLCLVGIAVFSVRLIRRSSRAPAVTAFRPLAEMTVAATGMVVGYAASTLTGPSHLQYGFARDFILPALLTAIVAVVLGSWLAWSALDRRRGGRISPEIAYVMAVVAVSVGVVAATTVTRSSGLPRLEARHVGALTYTARCDGGDCDVSMQASTTSGDAISIPSASTLTFGCGSEQPRLTLYASSLDTAVRVASACADPRLVAAWPTVMGLPAGNVELAAVRVRNA